MRNLPKIVMGENPMYEVVYRQTTHENFIGETNHARWEISLFMHETFYTAAALAPILML